MVHTLVSRSEPKRVFNIFTNLCFVTQNLFVYFFIFPINKFCIQKRYHFFFFILPGFSARFQKRFYCRAFTEYYNRIFYAFLSGFYFYNKVRCSRPCAVE